MIDVVIDYTNTNTNLIYIFTDTAAKLTSHKLDDDEDTSDKMDSADKPATASSAGHSSHPKTISGAKPTHNKAAAAHNHNSQTHATKATHPPAKKPAATKPKTQHKGKAKAAATKKPAAKSKKPKATKKKPAKAAAAPHNTHVSTSKKGITPRRHGWRAHQNDLGMLIEY